MRLIKSICLVLLGILLFSNEANACEFEFEVVEGKKNTYENGDIIVIQVKLILVHRNCPLAAKQTQFQYEGLNVLGATPWKSGEQTGIYLRKIKVKVKKGKKGISLSAVRTCELDGGFGRLELKRK